MLFAYFCDGFDFFSTFNNQAESGAHVEHFKHLRLAHPAAILNDIENFRNRLQCIYNKADVIRCYSIEIAESTTGDMDHCLEVYLGIEHFHNGLDINTRGFEQCFAKSLA